MHKPRRRALVALVSSAVCSTFLGSCRSKDGQHASPLEALEAALAPNAMAEALRARGGGHFHAVTSFRVEAPSDAKDGKPASPPVVVTTTDLWMDKDGGFRLVESNDQDGGREIVRVGSELGVALRYGKLIRRDARDDEAAGFLAEALGAPKAAWDVVRRDVELQMADGWVRMAPSKAHQRDDEAPPDDPITGWRRTIVAKLLLGQAQVDAPSSTAGRGREPELEDKKSADGRAGEVPFLRSFTCKASFTAKRGELPITGEVDVTAGFDQLGQVAAIAMPQAETLQARQRTVLEERALLGGLGAAASSRRAGKP